MKIKNHLTNGNSLGGIENIYKVIISRKDEKMNLTAQQAREIVAQSHIYKLIGEKASEGEMSMTIAYMTPEMFRTLSRNGFRVFTEDETAEFTQFDEDLMNTCDFFVVSWEG